MPDNRDWKKYNDQLVRRGEMYITLDFMETWDTEILHMNEGKRGRPFIFPHSLMSFLGFLHVAFLPYRQMEGFLKKLSQYIPQLCAADYSTICKRMHDLDSELSLQDIPPDVVVALDSTGMKVSSRGDWMRHKWRVRRGWIKVHIAVDVKTKKLLALEITDERTGDGQVLPSLVQQSQENCTGDVKRVLGDGAYDSKRNFNFLAHRGIEAGIKTRRNAVTRARGSPSRATHVRERNQLGYDHWRDHYQYGQRWSTETYFSGVKRVFGETTRCHTREALVQEVAMKFLFYNTLLGL